MSLKIQPDFSGAACGQAEVAEPWLTPVVDCCHSSGSRGKLSRLKEWSLKTPVVLPRWLSGKKKKKKNKTLMPRQETWVQFLSQEDPLEKEMATHPSILAWKVPWTEGSCRLQSLRPQKSWT